MSLSSILIWVFGCSLLCCGVLYCISRKLDQRNERLSYGYEASPQHIRSEIKKWISSFLLRSYAIFIKISISRYYLMKVRSRLAILHLYDEFRLRRQTMKVSYILVCSFGAVIAILVILNPSVMFLMTLLLTAVVIHGLLLEGYVNRVEHKLLKQMLQSMSAIRHAYHRHGMIADAIDEAGETAGEEMSRHAYRIHEALTDTTPDEALEKYYETAPNRFLKAFAGISRLVMEFGDRKSKERGSLYLRGIASLTGEIQLDLLRRTKLDYLLKGLNFIALIPIFFAKPVEVWARHNFPLMDQFYLSKAGMVVKIGLFVIILFCYILLQKLKGEEETSYRVDLQKIRWESKVYKWLIVRKAVYYFSPKPASASYDRIRNLLRDSNQTILFEWLQIRRLVMFLASVLFTISLCTVLHLQSRVWIMNEPPASYTFFGTLSDEDAVIAKEDATMDTEIMKELGMSDRSTNEEVTKAANYAMTENQKRLTKEQIKGAVLRVMSKLDRWNNEYVKWWEVLLSLLAGVMGYQIPVWVLMFQKKIRLMDMKHEVYQYQTVIAVLRELERISVEEILEWIHTYAVIFKVPIQKCLLHFGHGGEEALKQLKDEVALEEFKNIVDKLLLANEKITVAQAFDDLDSEMAYHFEQRRIDYEKSLDVKSNLGRMIGFTPMYCLVFAYLVIPLIWMSFKQMDFYFDQIQNL
ncbi:hypothetical protein SAMN04488542_103108 [Fontibacillus panacisegetis]|uniref:Uncharacterized protein n=1 Tax=Fontibacillus panacisegetis TaxID=670482 RepID=A0A1G7GLF2_9BACL|nr:hypothetical protein SAMN04488542_103108 [Fontibacillus panacisegetis]